MKSFIEVLVIIKILIIVIGCNKQKDVVFFDTNSKPVEIKFSELFDSLQIIPLETDQEYPIGEIEQIIKTKNHLIVLDNMKSKMVYIYNCSGKLVNVINPKGKGPGQFLEPRTISYDYFNNYIIVDEARLGKIMFFDLKGNFIKEHLLQNSSPISDLIYCNNSIFVNSYLPNNKYKIFSYDDNFNIIDKFLPFENNRKSLLAFNYFFPHYQDSAAFYYMAPYSNKLYMIDNGQLHLLYTFDLNNNIKDEKKLLEMDDREAVIRSTESVALKFLHERIIDSKDVLLFSIKNLYSGFGLLYKKNMHTLNINIINDMDGLASFSAIPYNYNIVPNSFIFASYPSELKSNVERVRGLMNKDLNTTYFQQTDSIYEHVQEFDNPVLFIYKFKNNINLDHYFK